MSMVKTDLVKSYENFSVVQHPQSERLYHIELKDEAVTAFLEKHRNTISQQLEYIPYMRYVIAKDLKQVLGEEFSKVINEVLHDREFGGFTLGIGKLTSSDEDYVKFSTAITHLIGGVNFDAMSGKYYARFTVKDTDNSDSYLRQAYRLFTLHTDGTFVNEPCDWLLMMKFAEENAIDGESRLLHLDDWEELDYYTNHPIASTKIPYKSPASKNVSQTVYNDTFFEHNGKPCIQFIDQFACPDTIEQAEYLKSMSESMENSTAVVELNLPVGDLVVLNNTFWLHGRAAFEKHPDLHRELLRQRGYFKKV
ncbi:glutarate dioxygenase GlaH [Alkalihalobacillus sp. TS-13]|uniref:glutarate dioxygenase GlaH n=1 Tax=Alkalihalobacillus sp. TS-13 TaxID=2842455 RepID=UPI001C87BDDA|nr:glutarate dioxygenase GlaH [Alkalihalobacillus sp. TS-13]